MSSPAPIPLSIQTASVLVPNLIPAAPTLMIAAALPVEPKIAIISLTPEEIRKQQKITFDPISIRTVSQSYQWDQGVPDLTFVNVISALSDLAHPSTANDDKTEYVGYAPYLSITLSSHPGYIEETETFKGIKRTVDFGDYYNSETNVVTDLTTDLIGFCHTYVMPGLYTIKYTQTVYNNIQVLDANPPLGNCLQQAGLSSGPTFCVDWSWGGVNSFNHPELSAFTWANTKSLSAYAKKWRFQPCTEDWAAGNGIYVQKTEFNIAERQALSWQWFNFQKNSPSNYLNVATPWLSTGFQQPGQLTWSQTTGPCVNLNYEMSDIVWTWNNITALSTTRFTADITWDDTSIVSPANATWNFTSINCAGNKTNLMLSATTQVITKEAYIRVIEALPVAYLKVGTPEDIYTLPGNTSPLTVRLSPRFTTCGSFPIEKIVWDLGDGSPLLVQRRWSPVLESPFEWTGALPHDYEDPRNYDIVHTYSRTPGSPYSFYPSITAYASSTGSSDSAAVTIGPLSYADIGDSNFTLMQSELTDNGKVLIGQIDNNIAFWRADK